MTDDRDTGPISDRPEPARDLAEADLESADDPDLTRPLPRSSYENDHPAAASSAGAKRETSATRRRIDTGSEWFWPIVNLIGVIAVIIVNWLANALPFNGQSSADVVNKHPVWFQPAGWAFSIWGLIYLLLVAFAIFGLFRAGRHNRWLQRISPLFLLANIANMVWLFFWHWEQFTAAMVTIVILLVSLLGIYTLLHWRRKDDREAPKGERMFVWPAFSIYLGWITVASLANLAVLLDRQGWDGGPWSLRWWAALMLIGAGVASAFFAFIRRDAWYPLVVAFASIAIAAEQWDRSSLVSIVAVIMGVIEVILVIVGVMMAFDRRAMIGMYSPKTMDTESVSADQLR